MAHKIDTRDEVIRAALHYQAASMAPLSAHHNAALELAEDELDRAVREHYAVIVEESHLETREEMEVARRYRE